MQQIIINFDSTGFEGVESPNSYLSFCSRTLRDSQDRPVKQGYQAADMDMSPAQWSQKLNNTNNTAVTLNEAFLYSQKFQDWRWLDYGNWLRSQAGTDDLEALEVERRMLEARIAKAKKAKR